MHGGEPPPPRPKAGIARGLAFKPPFWGRNVGRNDNNIRRYATFWTILAGGTGLIKSEIEHPASKKSLLL